MGLGGIMPVVAAAAIGAVASNSASKRAAKSSRNAGAEQRRQYEETKKFYEPYRALGEQGVSNLSKLYGGDYSGFEQSPGYQFRLSEGLKARENSASARGMSLSGGQMKALERFGSDYGSKEFSNYFERQRQLAGIGSSAISQGGQQGAYGAAQAGRFDAQAGQYDAAGRLGQAGAIMGGIGGIARYYGNQRFDGGGVMGFPSGFGSAGFGGGGVGAAEGGVSAAVNGIWGY